MTMINFKRTGGAVNREISFDVDLGTLPGPAAQRLHGLLTESNFFEIPTLHNLMAGPDEYHYAITAIAGNSLHTVYVTDTDMPESLHPLIDELTELARAAM